jgi:hypothetical protein
VPGAPQVSCFFFDGVSIIDLFCPNLHMYLWNNGLAIFSSPHRSLTCPLPLGRPKSTALPHAPLLRGIPGNAPLVMPNSPVGKTVIDTYYLTSHIGYIARSHIVPGEAIVSQISSSTGGNGMPARTTSLTGGFLDGNNSRYLTHKSSWIK